MTTPPAFPMHTAAWQTLQSIRGEVIVYHVHEALSITIEKAVLTQQRTKRVDVLDAVGFESRRWDWLIDPADLVKPDGTRIEPGIGHWIVRSSSSVKYVVTPNSNNVAWRWSDASQVWLRVFTEQS